MALQKMELKVAQGKIRFIILDLKLKILILDLWVYMMVMAPQEKRPLIL